MSPEVGNNDEPVPINTRSSPFFIRLWDDTKQFGQENPTVEVCDEMVEVQLLDDGLPPDPNANDNQFTGSGIACANGETPIVLRGPNGELMFETVVHITDNIHSASLNIHVGADTTTWELTSDEHTDPADDRITDKILALFYVGLGLIIGGLIGWKANKAKVG